MKKMYDLIDKVVAMITRVMSLMTVLLLLFLIAQIFSEGMQVFKVTSFWDFMTESEWRPLSDPPLLGVRNMVFGTVYVSLIALLISLPVSVGAAAFIALKAKGKTRVVILALIDLLIGIPSVVYGFVSFMLLVLFFERYLDFNSGETFFIAGLTLAVMVMPLMVSTITQSMDKVIDKYQVSAKALAVSQEYMTLKLIIPASSRGILMAILLAFSRAMGETMAVVMVIGNSNLAPTIFGKGMTLSGLITLEMGSAVLHSLHYKGLYAAGFVLMILLLMNNLMYECVKAWVKDYE